MQKIILLQPQLMLKVSVVTLECCLTTNYYYEIINAREQGLVTVHINETKIELTFWIRWETSKKSNKSEHTSGGKSE